MSDTVLYVEKESYDSVVYVWVFWESQRRTLISSHPPPISPTPRFSETLGWVFLLGWANQSAFDDGDGDKETRQKKATAIAKDFATFFDWR